MILQLVVQGALRSTTLLEGIVYPAWNIGASASVALAPSDEMMICSANDLFSRLMLQETPSGLGVPPADLFEMQYIRTRRQAVFDEPQFHFLAANIPALLALEDNEMVPESLRKSSTFLRCQLCQHPDFRRGAYRNLDEIRENFENSTYLVGSEQVSKRAIAGLKMIICDSSSGMWFCSFTLLWSNIYLRCQHLRLARCHQSSQSVEDCCHDDTNATPGQTARASTEPTVHCCCRD